MCVDHTQFCLLHGIGSRVHSSLPSILAGLLAAPGAERWCMSNQQRSDARAPAKMFFPDRKELREDRGGTLEGTLPIVLTVRQSCHDSSENRSQLHR
jgi:hypothetical protein